MYIRLLVGIEYNNRVAIMIIIIGTKEQNHSVRRKPILIILCVQILAANWMLYDKDTFS